MKRNKDLGLLQSEAVAFYLGLEIQKPKSINVYGEKIDISLFPKFKNMNKSTLSYYDRKR
jgi:hypothetical protein